MYIFGGIDQHHERFNDIHELVYDTASWTRVITIGNPPSPRTFHQSIMLNGYIHIMGGFDGWKRNDMYRILLESSSNSSNN
jgi:N-acetylneuraminic acid mutarotase